MSKGGREALKAYHLWDTVASHEVTGQSRSQHCQRPFETSLTRFSRDDVDLRDFSKFKVSRLSLKRVSCKLTFLIGSRSLSIPPLHRGRRTMPPDLESFWIAGEEAGVCYKHAEQKSYVSAFEYGCYEIWCLQLHGHALLRRHYHLDFG